MSAQGAALTVPSPGHTRCIEQLPVTFMPNLGALNTKADPNFILEGAICFSLLQSCKKPVDVLLEWQRLDSLILASL